MPARCLALGCPSRRCSTLDHRHSLLWEKLKSESAGPKAAVCAGPGMDQEEGVSPFGCPASKPQGLEKDQQWCAPLARAVRWSLRRSPSPPTPSPSAQGVACFAAQPTSLCLSGGLQ